MARLLDPLVFARGPEMKNRFMLAPLTNSQSFEDGTLSPEELHWLVMRAVGGFGLTMTCAAHVQPNGKGFSGQLGIWSDKHIEGLTRLSNAIHKRSSVAIVQLHHAGMRSPPDIIGEVPVCPSVDMETGSRALETSEVHDVVTDFVEAAYRAQRSGFDGVELHGAHGYLLCQFFSAETNRRQDEFGGGIEGRYRILFEIIRGIRERCRPDFQVGVRLSPERFGMKLAETMQVAELLMITGDIDFLDMSLWNVFKEPAERGFGESLIECFTCLERGNTKLGVAGQIQTPEHAERVMDQGVDWVMLGRAAILHHDFPNRYKANTRFEPVTVPVSRSYLEAEGLSEAFIQYMEGWEGFVEGEHG